jgi:hypothetical protein
MEPLSGGMVARIGRKIKEELRPGRSPPGSRSRRRWTSNIPDLGKRVAAIFEKSATDAARQWTFKVTSAGGKAYAVEVMIPIHFKLH